MSDKPETRKITPAPRAQEQRAIKLNEGSAKARRSAARLAAVQVLYQMEFNSQGAKEALSDFIDTRIGFELDGDVFVPADRELLTSIINGVFDKQAELNDLVKAQLAQKDKTQVDPILEAILLAACYELMAHHDIDAPIIISDYLNVAHAFYEDGAPKMINAILDTVSKALR
jgi:N utilization substance protein B